jgi:hypothetical protein
MFNDPLRVGGYSEFLVLLHGIRPHLALVIEVQHILGLASGLLLFGVGRERGVSAWAALFPLAVVVLGGSELFVEHAPLTETLFIFLVDLSLYCCVRTWKGHRMWAIVAGLALGAAACVRTVGLPLTLATVVVAPLCAPKQWRQRLILGVAIVIGAAVPIGTYIWGHE